MHAKSARSRSFATLTRVSVLVAATFAVGAAGCRRSSGFAAGQTVQAQWGTGWYAAQIVSVLPAGQYRIHYVGWAQSWDENVPAARLRTSGTVSTSAPAQVLAGLSAVVAPASPPTETSQSSSVDPGGMPATDVTPLAPGQPVQVQWGASWYASRVVAPIADGSVRIHYMGWPVSSDENVARARIRIGGVIRTAAAVVPAPAVPAPIAVAAPIPAAPAPTAVVAPTPAAPAEVARSSSLDPGGAPVTTRTRLVPSQAVQARWGSSWYDARVVATHPDGTVRVHYLGWSSSSDETMPRARLRIGGTIRPS